MADIHRLEFLKWSYFVIANFLYPQNQKKKKKNNKHNKHNHKTTTIEKKK